MHAEKWDSMHITEKLLHRIKTKIMPNIRIKKGERVLDIGCGTGILLPFIRKKAGVNSKVTALDYSKKMLKKAEEKYGEKYNYVCANATRLPFKRNSYDTVICFNVFPHFPKKYKVLSEISRTLKPKGRLYIVHGSSLKEIEERHKKAGKAVMHDVLPDNDKMKKLLSNSGFKDIYVIDKKDHYIVSGITS